MTQGETVSTQTEKGSKESKETVVDKTVGAIKNLVEGSECPHKSKFADEIYKEISKEIPLKNAKALIKKFKETAKDGLKPEEYTKIWEESFYPKKTPKEKFAAGKYKELLKKGNIPEPQIKSLINSFRAVVKENLKEEEYEKIWKKTFYRGHK